MSTTPTAAETKTLTAFNNGRVLKVVQLPDGKLGVIDDAHLKVWVEHDWASVWMPGIKDLPAVSIPEIPSAYGTWDKKSIGGVSWTVRRIGLLRGSIKFKGAFVVFAVHVPEKTTVVKTLEHLDGCCIGQTEEDDDFGIVNEIVVYHHSGVSQICALLARAGCTVMLEDASMNAHRCLAVERMDRIPSKAMDKEIDDDDAYGLRRGSDNWRFPWLPSGWKHVPITWDHLVANVLDTTRPEDIESIPQPLRQHVAAERIRQYHFQPIGTRWKKTHAPSSMELLGSEPPNSLSRVVWKDPPASLRANPREEHSNLPEEASLQKIFQADDGEWYRPVDTRRFLQKHIPPKRFVSAALSTEQSKQLLTCFYLLVVEEVNDVQTRHAAALILFQYFKERGYTARWLGKYVQDAGHVGNGENFRKFVRLSQYAPERLPKEVLEKLCGKNGRLVNRGSKGSRSKYKPKNARYIPRRRLKRTRDDEQDMMEGKQEEEKEEKEVVVMSSV